MIIGNITHAPTLQKLSHCSKHFFEMARIKNNIIIRNDMDNNEKVIVPFYRSEHVSFHDAVHYNVRATRELRRESIKFQPMSFFKHTISDSLPMTITKCC